MANRLIGSGQTYTSIASAVTADDVLIIMDAVHTEPAEVTVNKKSHHQRQFS